MDIQMNELRIVESELGISVDVLVGAIEDALPQAVVMSKSSPDLNRAVQAAIQYLMDSGIWKDILDAWGIQDAALTTAEMNPKVEE